jgi:hypothetical protein
MNEVAVCHEWKKVNDALVLDETGTLLKVTEAILDLGYKVPKRTTFPGRPTRESIEEALKLHRLL